MSSGICSSYEPSTRDLSTNDLPNTATHGRLQFLTVYIPCILFYVLLCRTIKQGCPASVKLCLTEDCQQLTVSHVNMNHNHDVNKVVTDVDCIGCV